jgi:hypothetical protein
VERPDDDDRQRRLEPGRAERGRDDECGDRR